MTEREALYRAICSDPDDDVPRLVFADWLQEHGEDDRAEFIRLQIALEHTAVDHPDRPEMRLRERELWLTHGGDWLAELPQIPDVSWGRFRRGFAESIILTGPPADLAAVRAAVPLRSIRLSIIPGLADGPDNWQRMLCWDGVGQIRRLEVNSVLADDFVGELLAREEFHGLRELEIATADDWLPSLPAFLADSPILPGLTTLGLYGSEGCAEFALAVLRNENPPALRALDLSGSVVRGGLMYALAQAPGFGRVRSLSLSHAFQNPDVLSNLILFPTYRSLRELDLSGNEVPDIPRMIDPLLDQLAALDLTACGLSQEDLSVVLDNDRPGSLRRLGLSGNEFRISNSRGGSLRLVGIVELDLGSTNLTAKDLNALSHADGFSQLRSLHLAWNRLGDAGTATLARATSGLKTLDLTSDRVTDSGVARLAESEGMTELFELSLAHNDLTDQSARRIADAGTFRSLVVLNLAGNRLTPAGVAALRDAPGLPKLRHVITDQPPGWMRPSAGPGERGSLIGALIWGG